MVEEVLPPFLIAPHFDAVHALAVSLLHLLVFATDLLSRALGEVRLDQSEISSIEFNELILLGFTS